MHASHECHLRRLVIVLSSGVTGGLAAPLVAAGAGAVLGAGGAAALGSATGIAIMASLFGAAGAGLTGQHMYIYTCVLSFWLPA